VSIRFRRTVPHRRNRDQAKLPADLVKALRIRALERETTVKDLLTRLIREYLARERSRAGRTQ
jgi:hypothetical protein